MIEGAAEGTVEQCCSCRPKKNRVEYLSAEIANHDAPAKCRAVRWAAAFDASSVSRRPTTSTSSTSMFHACGYFQPDRLLHCADRLRLNLDRFWNDGRWMVASLWYLGGGSSTSTVS